MFPYQLLSAKKTFGEVHRLIINGVMHLYDACFLCGFSPAKCMHSHAKQIWWTSSLVYSKHFKIRKAHTVIINRLTQCCGSGAERLK